MLAGVRRSKASKLRVIAMLLLVMGMVSPAVAGTANPWKGTWIWSETPREDNYFRKVIDVPGEITQAKLAITADNIYTLHINGSQVGADTDWTSLDVYDITHLVKPGRNVLAVKATDPGADVGALLVEGAIVDEHGEVFIFGTDRTWRMSGSEAPGWTTADFDDSAWQSPREIGRPPVGPWGGIEHPTLAPKVPMETVAVYWPKQTAPGGAYDVVCKVRPARKIALNSPVALRVLANGQTVCEQWIEPDAPASEWTPGEVRTIAFRQFRLPIYVPTGKLQAEIVTIATQSTGAKSIWIGPRTEPPAPPRVTVSDLNVQPIEGEGAVELSIRAECRGVSKSTKFLFALFRGEEMWFAADVASAEPVRITLPASFPGGVYTARLLPHRAPCVKCVDPKVTVPGPAQSSWKPLGYGTCVDRGGVPHRWYVNSGGALIWDGKPYIPVGAMYLSRFFMEFSATNVERNEGAFRDDLERLRAMKTAGVTDLYLNPCNNWNDKPAWVWQRFADMCEEVGLNYGIQVTNHLGRLKGYHIAQDEYVVRIESGETARAEITGTYVGRPDANSAVLYAAFDTNTGELADWGKATVKPTKAGIEAEAAPRAPAGGSLSVRFIPEYVFVGDMHDYWQHVDESYESTLNTFFSALRLGPGFRLWIDPLDNEQSFRDLNRLLPHSPRFREMFADYLQDKYLVAHRVVDAWAVERIDLNTDFATLARLVPLGKPSVESDTGFVLDESTGRTYKVDLARSAMWFDVLRFRDSSIAEFNSRVAAMIKRHHDAPVVLKVTDTDCFTNLRTHGGFDGLGMEAYGAAPELVRGCGGGVYSRCKQANRTMWTLTTETGLAEPPVGYPDPVRMTRELGSMAAMNAKGTFYFLLSAPSGRPGEGWYVFNLFEDPRQLHWLGAFSRLMKSSAELPGYEPEVDYYFPGSLAGQVTGFARAEPSFHGDIPSQSVPGESGRWVVPASTRIPSDAARVIVSLEDSPATSIYGPEFENALKTRQVVVIGHRKDLGALSVDSYYTGRFVEDGEGGTVQALTPTPTSRVFARTADGVVYGLTDGSLTIYSRSDWISAVKKMAGPATGQDFFAEVLGLREPDLGKAFQAMGFGPTTYLWNLASQDHALTLDVPAGAKETSVILPDGTKQEAPAGESVRLALPALAARPAIIENLPDARIAGVDRANLLAAMQEWSDATERAKALGIETSVMPPSNDWREIYELAADLRRRAEDTYRTTTAVRMPAAKVDGDLSEWAGIDPIYLKMDVGVDFARAQDYDGARFYTGYDRDYLYVAGDVSDEAIVNNYRLDGIWNGDAIEVFIDLRPDYDPLNRNYNADCFQFLFAPTSIDGVPAMVVKNPKLPPGSVPQNTLWSVQQTKGGWRFEAAIGRADLNGFTFEPGRAIGFTIQLDDSDGGDRTSARLWRGGRNASRDRLDFGRLVFGK